MASKSDELFEAALLAGYDGSVGPLGQKRALSAMARTLNARGWSRPVKSAHRKRPVNATDVCLAVSYARRGSR